MSVALLAALAMAACIAAAFLLIPEPPAPTHPASEVAAHGTHGRSSLGRESLASLIPEITPIEKASTPFRSHDRAILPDAVSSLAETPHLPSSPDAPPAVLSGRTRGQIARSTPWTEGQGTVPVRPGTPLSLALAQGGHLTDLTPAEKSAVEQANKRFDSELGDPASRDPESAEYFGRWRGAVSVADEMLRAALGWERYNQLSRVLTTQR